MKMIIELKVNDEDENYNDIHLTNDNLYINLAQKVKY